MLWTELCNKDFANKLSAMHKCITVIPTSAIPSGEAL